MLDNFFDYVIYSTFSVNLLHGNSNRLSVQQIHDFRICILNSIKDFFSQYDSFDNADFEVKLKKYIKTNEEMSLQSEVRYLKEFLSEHDDLFGYDDGILYLKVDISPDGLNDLKFELESYTQEFGNIIGGHMISYFDAPKTLDVLGTTVMKDDVLKFHNLERTIEDSYATHHIVDTQNLIRFGNLMVASKLKKLASYDHSYINSYYRMVKNLEFDEMGHTPLSLLSEDVKFKDDFYENNNYIDYEMSNRYLHAIFGTKNLAWEKMLGYMDILEESKRPVSDEPIFEPADGDWDKFLEKFATDEEIEFDDEFDDEEYDEFFFERETEEDDEDRFKYQVSFKFYLKYIEMLNRFMSINGELLELSNAKKRLLYLLDQHGLFMFDNKRFEMLSSKVSFEDLEYKRDMYDFYTISRLFLIDILKFGTLDNNVLRKLLFVSNYYNITDDVRIKRIINKYKKTEVGNIVYNSIMKNDWSYFSNGDQGLSLKR